VAETPDGGTVAKVSTSANLAVRYRPRRFAELTGQRHVAAVLCAAVRQQRLPQQLLFTGGSGLGKTTVARIAAAAALCETTLDERDSGDACGRCRSCGLISQPSSQHPDVIELDAASHCGKDEIVAIVNRAQTRPLLGPFKVYIIDEVHALSGAGVQAFLKLLEEPPAHVLFMLATTNPEKLSSRSGGTGTIRGRCVEFELLAPTEAELVANLLRIAAAEGWVLRDEVAAMVADVSDPALGVRGTVNMLAKLAGPLSAGQELDVDTVVSLLGALPRQAIAALTDAIRQRDLGAALHQLEQIRQISSDRNIRAALVRWARRNLDDALTGRAALSPELALHRFEQLISVGEGPLHTDLVVARLARPALVSDAETLGAQLHEAQRLLERLGALLSAGDVVTLPGHATLPGHPQTTAAGSGRDDAAYELLDGEDDAEDESGEDDSGEDDAGDESGEDDAGDDSGEDEVQPDDGVARGATEPFADDPIAGSFDDLSDLLVAAAAPGDPLPPDPLPPGVPAGAPTGAVAPDVAAFVAAAQQRSVTAAAVARSVDVVIGPGRITLQIPAGLHSRVTQHLTHLRGAAGDLGATLEVSRADAEHVSSQTRPEQAATGTNRPYRKDQP
jgi:DNA polymerase III subunit gamma/tau